MNHILDVQVAIGSFTAAGSKGARSAEVAEDIHVIDPLVDRRWDELVAQHAQASPFHLRGWLQALQRTYGYRPFVITSATPGEAMKDGVVFCQISSWLTGTRAVSLPFADHCEPLVSGNAECFGLLKWLHGERIRQQWKYLEVRPLRPFQSGTSEFQPSHSYCMHELDLRPSLEHIFQSMHRDSVQRRIRHAERAGLTYEKGRSSELLDAFYRLLLITRKRLQILPQPRSWFRNLLGCMGDNLQIRLARKDGRPVASTMTLKHRRAVIYKYGCSDQSVHHLGGMPLLFWKMIEESKDEGAETLDFGRSDPEHEGLIRFKDKFNARRRNLMYYRSPVIEKRRFEAQRSKTAARLVSMLPDEISCVAGQILYRHMG